MRESFDVAVARAVAPLAVYSAAKYDETMTTARKRASVMLGL